MLPARADEIFKAAKPRWKQQSQIRVHLILSPLHEASNCSTFFFRILTTIHLEHGQYKLAPSGWTQDEVPAEVDRILHNDENHLVQMDYEWRAA